MNKFTKLAAWFLAGTMLAFAGCSDYDDDIDAVNKRVDELTTGKIATLEEQAAALKSSLSSLEAAYKAADTELKNQLAKQLEDLTKADDALQKAIDKVKTDLTAKHDQDVQTLRGEITKAVGDLMQALDAAKSELEGKITGVDNKVSALDSKVENYNTTLTNKIKAVADDLAAVSGKLTALEGTVAALSSKHDADLAALRTEIAEKVAAAKAEVLEQLASDKAELQGQITAAVERIAALETSVTTLKGQITAIEGQISQMQTAIAGKVDKSDFEAYTKQTDAAIKANAEALGVLQALCAGFPGNTTIKGYVDAAIADVTSAVSAVEGRCTALENDYRTLSENFGAFKASIEPRVKANEDALAVLNAWKEEMTAEGGTVDQLKARIKALEDNRLTLDDVKAQFTAEVAEFKSGVDAVIAQALAADGAITAAIAAKAGELTQAFDAKLAALSTRVAALEVNVDELMNRIQSLVYVPAVNDHKASVHALYFAAADKDPVLLADGQVVMTFRVTPVEAAAQLVAAYTKDPAIFAFEMEKVATRAAAPALEIEKVEVDPLGNGRFIVTARPAGFDPDFFTGKVSYSVALRLQKAYDAEAEADKSSADAVSDYVNLTPARTEVEAVVLAPATEEGAIDTEKILAAGGEVRYEIPFNDTETIVELLKDYQLWFTDGEEYFGLDALKKKGFAVEAPEVACTSRAYNVDGTAFDSADKGNFTVTDAADDACDETVKLAAADKTTRDNYLLTEHTYTMGELAATFNTRVTIVKTKSGVTLEQLTYYWTYSHFLPIYDANDGSVYQGSAQQVEIKIDEEKSNLPEDIEPADLIKDWDPDTDTSIEVKVVELDAEGNKTETVVADFKVTPVSYDEEKGYTLSVEGWKFGKSYAVVMSRSLDDLEVAINFDAAFVPLPETIEYTLPAVTLAYDATEELFAGEKSAVAEELYKQVENHFADAAELATSLTRAYQGGNPGAARAKYTATCGERELSMSKWFTDSSTPAKITRIAVANDGKMTAHMQVNRADVETDADTFVFDTEITPNYGLKIHVRGEATVELPAYAVKHVDAWVYEKDGKWQSDVKGLWTPNFLSHALTGFTVDKVELESAFEIVKKDAQGAWVSVEADEIAAQKLAFGFEIPEGDEYDGITIADNKLSYYGRSAFVPVSGALSIDGIVIGNAFTAVNDYTSYVVNKFDPIRSFTQEEIIEIPTRTAEATYTKNVCEVLSLRDKRDADDGKGFELIDHTATLADPWITGDGANGFATGVRPSDSGVFGLSAITIVQESITYADNGFDASTALGDRVTIDKTTGAVTFSNLNNLSLQKDIDVVIYVEVSYPWDVKRGTVTYQIKK